MIKTHEIQLNTSIFNQVEKNNYIIVDDKNKKIEVNDYILFKQTEIIQDEDTEEQQIKETGLYIMGQVTNIITSQGLKEGYVLLTIRKI